MTDLALERAQLGAAEQPEATPAVALVEYPRSVDILLLAAIGAVQAGWLVALGSLVYWFV